MTRECEAFGLVAEFASSADLLAAARKTTTAGYRAVDTYSPFSVIGLSEALGDRKNSVAAFCLAGGLFGGIGGYFMQDYALSASYPLDIGGRPFHNIPPYIPITFELTILGAALFTAIGMIALAGLPRLHHPLFGTKGFERATKDRFFLCIEATDPLYERPKTEAFLASLNPLRVTEVTK